MPAQSGVGSPTPGRRGAALRTLARALRLLQGADRRRWLSLLPLGLFAAAIESAGAGLVYALVQTLTAPGGAPATVRLPGPLAALVGDAPSALRLAWVVAVFYLLKNLFLLFQTWWNQRAASASILGIADRLLRAYLSAPWTMHVGRSSAEFIRNVHQSVDQAFRLVLISGANLVSEGLVVVGLLVVLLRAAPGPTLLLGGFVGGAVAIFLRASHTRLRGLGRQAHALHGELQGLLQQSLAGAKELRVLGREGFFVDEHRRTRGALATVMNWRASLEVVPRLLTETVFIAGIAGLLWLGEVTQTTGEVLPVLGLFGYAGFRILPSLSRAVWYVNNIHYGAASVDAVLADFPLVSAPLSSAGPSRTLPRPFSDGLVLDDVSFTWPGAARASLERLSLWIEPGDTIGIVGPTGAGKSTLLDILLGLVEPDSGRILLDGSPLHTDLRGWLANIGYVPQAPTLFDDTLRRNVALGIADGDIDEDAVREALQLAQLDARVARLPQGLDTRIGERGLRLSGGERQRLAVARALYHRPRVLLFDEATSALDGETEAALVEAIEHLGASRTLIVVAHRLATVRRSKRLLVLDQGRLEASGTWDTLAAESPTFKRLLAASESNS